MEGISTFDFHSSWHCGKIADVKTGMGHKTGNFLFLALFFALASPAIAGEVVSVSPPDPSFDNCESTAKIVMPILETGTPVRLMVSIDCLNTATNEFEVWFCTDEDASREFRDLAICLDDGCLFMSGRDDEYLLPDVASMPLGQCALDIELRNRLYNQDTLLVKSGVNGTQIPVLTAGLGMVTPREWRSVRVVSRGMGNASDMTVTVSKGEVGFSVILR